LHLLNAKTKSEELVASVKIHRTKERITNYMDKKRFESGNINPRLASKISQKPSKISQKQAQRLRKKTGIPISSEISIRTF